MMRVGARHIAMVLAVVVACTSIALLVLQPRSGSDMQATPSPPADPSRARVAEPGTRPTVDEPRRVTADPRTPVSASSQPRREREHVGREPPCTEPHGALHLILELTPPDVRSHAWWAVELQRRIVEHAQALHGEARSHVHTRLEPDGARVRIWIDRGSRDEAFAAYAELLRRIEEARPEITARRRKRDELEDAIRGYQARSRIAAVDRRYVIESSGLRAESIDVDIRTVEAELDAWAIERAEARARRGVPGMTTAEVEALDRHLTEADAAVTRLRDRLDTLRGVARKVAALDAEQRAQDERRATFSRELEELTNARLPAPYDIRIWADLSDR